MCYLSFYCHAPLSNWFFSVSPVSSLIFSVFLSFLYSSRRALSSLPLQSCEKVGTVTTVWLFQSLPSIFSFLPLNCHSCLCVFGCFMCGTEGLNPPVQFSPLRNTVPCVPLFSFSPVSACVFAVRLFFFGSIFCVSVHKIFNGAHLKTP